MNLFEYKYEIIFSIFISIRAVALRARGFTCQLGVCICDLVEKIEIQITNFKISAIMMVSEINFTKWMVSECFRQSSKVHATMRSMSLYRLCSCFMNSPRYSHHPPQRQMTSLAQDHSNNICSSPPYFREFAKRALCF